MNLSPAEARARLAGARVARLATADADGVPHIVPIAFAVDGDTVYFAVDHKPKRSTDLRRLRNIAANPRVAVLADHYADDWTALWWARADGRARVHAAAGVHAADADTDGDDDSGAGFVRPHALDLLCRKYPQYAETPPAGPVVAIRVHAWTGWSFAG